MITGYKLLLPLLFFIHEKQAPDLGDVSFTDPQAQHLIQTGLPRDTNYRPLVLALKTPTGVVSDKADGYEATVIVKSKTGHGSGFAVTNNGYIITAYEAIDQENEDSGVTIITSDGEEVGAVVMRADSFAGLALVKADRQFPKAFKCPLTKQFKLLQTVYGVGASISLELGQSVSAGIISNERVFDGAQRLQLNMSVNYGMSGGPVFDEQGLLHGVIVSKLIGENTEGVSFAVPAYLIADYMNLRFN
jgi:S1-C subfamily serine protease